MCFYINIKQNKNGVGNKPQPHEKRVYEDLTVKVSLSNVCHFVGTGAKYFEVPETIDYEPNTTVGGKCYVIDGNVKVAKLSKYHI